MTHFARHNGIRVAFAISIATLAGPALATDISTLIAGAKGGDAQAQFNLGNAYMKGEGVHVDAARGVKWCRLAADQGYTPAQSQLALKYASGDGVAKNNVESDKWMVLAASADAHYQTVQAMVEGPMTPRELRRGHAAAAQWTAAHAIRSPIKVSGE